MAIEEPLEIRVDGRALAVTMRTPGADEELAVGFLLGEGLIAGRDDVADVGPNAELEANIVEVTTRAGLRRDPFAERRFHMTSSCGVCGKGALEQVRLEVPARPPAPVRIEPAQVLDLPGRARPAQDAFDRTGGIHATALFTAGGELLVLREDVGRHNAMDKAIGALVLDRGEAAGALACLSGRIGFELVQKAVMGGLSGHRGGGRSHVAGGGAGPGARPAAVRLRPRRRPSTCTPAPSRSPARRAPRGLRPSPPWNSLSRAWSSSSS